MKNIFLSLLVLLFFLPLKAQEGKTDSTKIARSTVYVELLGSCGFYSLNSDLLLTHRLKKNKISISAGVSYNLPTVDYGHKYYFTSAIHYLRGERHHLDIWLGPTFRMESKESYNAENDKLMCFAVVGVAYRLQKPQGGFFLSIGLLKYFPYTEDDVPVWGGLGFGYTFKQQTA
ncbi:MAG TPA: hypothetical protein VK826_04375 [Bacteroidia bacterium]|nr:hypothetical protein [Bacteroidia bacterium]